MKVRRRRPKPQVMGVDPSLTATGVVVSGREPETIKASTPKTGYDTYLRLISIRDCLMDRVRELDQPVLVIENYSHASKFQAHQLGELGGVIRTRLLEEGVPFYLISPNTLKMLATGKGNASKEAVGYEAVKRFEATPSDNNQADALWLWELGNHLIGQPTVDLPKSHVRALEGLNGPIG